MTAERAQSLIQRVCIKVSTHADLSPSLPCMASGLTLFLWLWLFSLMAWSALSPDARRGLLRIIVR